MSTVDNDRRRHVSSGRISETITQCDATGGRRPDLPADAINGELHSTRETFLSSSRPQYVCEYLDEPINNITVAIGFS